MALIYTAQFSDLFCETSQTTIYLWLLWKCPPMNQKILLPHGLSNFLIHYEISALWRMTVTLEFLIETFHKSRTRTGSVCNWQDGQVNLTSHPPFSLYKLFSCLFLFMQPENERWGEYLSLSAMGRVHLLSYRQVYWTLWLDCCRKCHCSDQDNALY